MNDGSEKHLFSEKALENLESGRQRELLNNTVSFWNWFSLAALTFFLAAALYWGFFGTMTENVRGLGITVSGGIEAITARSSGLIQSLTIAPGEHVIRGRRSNTRNFKAGFRIWKTALPDGGTERRIRSAGSRISATC